MKFKPHTQCYFENSPFPRDEETRSLPFWSILLSISSSHAPVLAYSTPARLALIFVLSPLEHDIPHDLLSNCYWWKGEMERLLIMKNLFLHSVCLVVNETGERKRREMKRWFIHAALSIPSLLLKWPFEMDRIAFLKMPSPHSKTRNAPQIRWMAVVNLAPF